MKSTGEVMGIDRDFRKAYVKSQIAAGSPLPTTGKVFRSVKNRDKRAVLQVAKRLADMGFGFCASTNHVLGHANGSVREDQISVQR